MVLAIKRKKKVKSTFTSTYLGKAIRMSADDGYVAFARGTAVLGGVLLDVQQEGFVLGGCCCARVFADVRCLDGVLVDVEDGGHCVLLYTDLMCRQYEKVKEDESKRASACD